MKLTSKRLLSLVLCLLMILSCVPVAGAEDDVASQDYSDNDLYTSKTIHLENDGTYTIELESFITGTITESPTPLDIVLVLDQSASMVNNVMTDMPENIRFQTPATNWTYRYLLSLSKLIYLPGDGYFYEAKVERTSDGSVYGIYTLNGVTYKTTAYTQTLTLPSGSTVTLNGYHSTNKTVSFVLDDYFDWSSFSTKYRYYNAADTSEQTSGFSTESAAYEYLRTTYLTTNYPDYTASSLTSNGSTYMDEVVFYIPITTFKWENTQYTISYYKDGSWVEGEVDTCGGWYTSTPTFPTSDSDITARCTSENLYFYTRSNALQTGAYDFILNMQEIAGEQGVDHRVALVGFSSGLIANSEAAESVTTDYYGTELLSTAEKVNFGSATTENYQDALQSVLNEDGTGNTRLTDAVSLIDGYSTTHLSYGLEMAQNILDARTETTYTIAGKELPRETVVIIFTDGIPGNYDKLGNFADYTDRGPITSANRALAEAQALKDAGTKIYCIGMLEGVDPTASYNFDADATCTIGDTSYSCYSTQADAINAYLHFLSSDYSNAPDMLTPDRSSVVNKGFVYAALSSSALHEAFLNISGAATSTTITLNKDAVVRDIMAEGFDLPEDIEENPGKYVTTYTSNYLGEEKWDAPELVDTFPIRVDKATKTVDVTGFDYEEHYIHEEYGDLEAGGQKLIIQIKGVTANDAAVQNTLVNTNDPASGVYEAGNLEAVFQAFVVPTELLQEKSFVMDYFACAEIDPAEVNVFFPLHISKDHMHSFSAYNTYVECANGTVELKDGTLYYTPKTADFHEADSFYLFGQDASGENVWAKITILPANNVFYEDEWVSYSENWSLVGESANNGEIFNNPVHGYIESKAGESGFSNGSAHFSEDQYATAEFTFTGTGIDIYTRTDGAVGASLAVVSADGEVVASITKDNVSTSGTYYQIPTMFFHGLDYGTYTVKLTIRDVPYDNNRNDYYFDGYRVYEPLGPISDMTDEMAALTKEAYGVEFNASYDSIRELILSAESFGSENGIEGAVFIDDVENDSDIDTPAYDSTSMQDYTNYGPKNEVYLQTGNAIILRVDSSARYFVGIKSPTGSATVIVSDGEGTKEIAVNTTADLYYEVVPSSEGYIMIQSSSGMIALTKLRTCNTATGLSLRSATADELLDYANRFGSLEQTEQSIPEALTVTKAPKQPKSIFRNIKKPIVGREQK